MPARQTFGPNSRFCVCVCVNMGAGKQGTSGGKWLVQVVISWLPLGAGELCCRLPASVIAQAWRAQRLVLQNKWPAEQNEGD